MNENTENFVISDDGKSVMISLLPGFIIEKFREEAKTWFALAGASDDKKHAKLCKTCAKSYLTLADNIQSQSLIKQSTYKIRNNANQTF